MWICMESACVYYVTAASKDESSVPVYRTDLCVCVDNTTGTVQQK